MNWKPIETAPKDGTWILGINNRGNQAVIIWSESAPDKMGGYRAGWIHPFSDGRLSSFWNGGCGSVATHWMPLPAPPESVGYNTRDSKPCTYRPNCTGMVETGETICLRCRIRRNTDTANAIRQTLGTLITWLGQCASSPVSPNEAQQLLAMLECGDAQ